MVIPALLNLEAVFLAAGVLGATIMPHVIYLHSSANTASARRNAQPPTSNEMDVAIKATIAGFVNLAMMANTAAAAFHL